MEFAEWVVSGLDQYRLGRLPGGEGFFQAVWGRLGSDPRLTAFLNTGDPGARQALVGLVAQTVQHDPGFGQQLRAAAPGSPSAPAETMTAPVYGGPGFGQPAYGPPAGQQPPAYGPPGFPQPGYGAPAAKPAFFKTTGGIVAIAVAVLALAGGGVGLAMALGGGGTKLSEAVKGTWHCSAVLPGQSENGTADLQIGDGTWSVGDSHGTWKQDGGTVTLTDSGESSNLIASGVPDSTGKLDVELRSTKPGSTRKERITGTTSKDALNLKVTMTTGGNEAAGISIAVTCSR